MRPVVLADVIAAAATLRATEPERREAVMRLVMAEAKAADDYRRRYGRNHPRWGNGTLMAAALAHGQGAAPRFDREGCGIWIEVLSALAKRGVSQRHS